MEGSQNILASIEHTLKYSILSAEELSVTAAVALTYIYRERFHTQLQEIFEATYFVSSILACRSVYPRGASTKTIPLHCSQAFYVCSQKPPCWQVRRVHSFWDLKHILGLLLSRREINASWETHKKKNRPIFESSRIPFFVSCRKQIDLGEGQQ